MQAPSLWEKEWKSRASLGGVGLLGGGLAFLSLLSLVLVVLPGMICVCLSVFHLARGLVKRTGVSVSPRIHSMTSTIWEMKNHTEKNWNILKRLNCSHTPGYYFSICHEQKSKSLSTLRGQWVCMLLHTLHLMFILIIFNYWLCPALVLAMGS